MTTEPDAIRYRRIRAPREDGQALIDPPLAAGLAHLRAVRGERSDSPRNLVSAANCCGKSLADLAREARREVLDLAAAYTSQYRRVDGPTGADAVARPIVMSGHQPTLFHPGVWFKNFALSALAEQGEATAINLVVDNDTLRSASVRAPTGSPDAPLFENVPYDEATDEVPFEERPLRSGELFDSFADRVQRAFQPMLERTPLPSYTPLVDRLWTIARHVRRRRDRATSIGWLLAEARHQLEGELGLTSLELPLSQMCDTASFRWFVVGLLAELPRLLADYNALLAEYRVVNRIRSRSHPVPDLTGADDWLESPFWVWTRDNPRRRHLFARRRSDVIEITDRAELTATLPFSADGDAAKAVERLGELRGRGIKLRPRALATTMFSRLLACDLFLHGIGGAKYDELTDAIIRRFFQLEPPPYLTITATLQLPIARPTLSQEDLRRSQQRLREVAYHPERFAEQIDESSNKRFAPLAARKRQLLDDLPGLRASGESLKGWRQEMVEINQSMSALLGGYRDRLAAEQPKLGEQLLAAQRLGSREFSFVLFPEETLPEQLKRLATTP